MSKYTTELRYICESLAPQISPDNPSAIIHYIIAHRLLFNFNYPIANPNHQQDLEEKILRHYYFHEIGSETFGRWRFQLESRMREIMPKYNLLYNNAEWDFKALVDTSLKDILDRDIKDTDHEVHAEQGDKAIADNSTYVTNTNKTDTNTRTGSIDNSKSETTNGSFHNTETQTRNDNETLTEDSTTTYSGTETESFTDNVVITQSGTTITAESDTPQGSLSGVEDLTYLTKATKVAPGAIDTHSGGTSTSKTFDDRNDFYDGHATTSTVEDISKNTAQTKNDTTTGLDTQTFKDLKDLNTISGSESNRAAKTSSIKYSGDKARERHYSRMDDYIKTLEGRSGKHPPAELLKSYYDNIQDIDMLIIRDLSCLFMQIY